VTVLPDCKNAEQRQAYIKQHAEFFTATVRVNGVAYRSEHATLEGAKAAANY
jgi:hypothetical protein